MPDHARSLLVGAVAYHPRVVTVWEGFKEYFREGGLDLDYLLFSNYERLVEALLDGIVDLAWNTNTAYVSAEARLGGRALILGMRDVDAGYASLLVTRTDDPLSDLRELAGATLALGSRDSGHAAILPLHFLAAEGVPLERVQLLRFDTDLGKHGDTGDSERKVVRAVAEGRARAGAIGDATWAQFRAERLPETDHLQVAWRSPTYSHCCFTARPDLDPALARRWLELLLRMDYNDPRLRPVMDLEGVKRWLPGDKAGYAALQEAMRQQGYLRG
ncbi:MAG TPA: PhnD/SsuA/transferrin family substrate-binding protein [Candidatus Dormibacteraeota bacterium]|nr:PhnD/SsuA/transferrin family substrate-binding protein [Candidatus Dormibacteraeota bacterium]